MFGLKISYPALNDEQLMVRVSKGERKAFEALYDRYFNKLVWFARSFMEDVQHAEDLVQDVFIRLIEKPGQFDPGKRFSTWIYVVTANRCRQSLRDEKNRLRILEEKILPFKEKSAEQGQNFDLKLFRKKIQAAYSGLNEKEKNIYTLRFEQEMAIRDIAQILEIPEGSVKSGIYYLLKKLAYQLKDFSYEY